MGGIDAGRRVCSDCEEGHLGLASLCLGERDSAGSCRDVNEDATKGTAFEGPGSLALDKALVSASTALGGAVIGGSENLYLEEPDESCFAEPLNLYLEEPEPELALVTAGEGLAECSNGFGGVCANGLGPKGLIFEGSAPKDVALERDPEDATREVPTLAAAALDGSGLDDSCLDGPALVGSCLDGPPIGGLVSRTDAL